MVARESHRFPGNSRERSYGDLLRDMPLTIYSKQSIFRFRPSGRTVRSVQRLGLPLDRNAEWVKDQYLLWLPKFFSPLIKVVVRGPTVIFAVFSPRWVLLELNCPSSGARPIDSFYTS